VSTRVVRTLLVAVPLLIVTSVGGLGYAAYQGRPGNYVSSKTEYGNAPSWTLTDQNGKTVSSDSLAGKVQVVSYMFPYCRTFCPAMTHVMAALEADLKDAGLAGKRVQLVAFNVDPANTGPTQMRTFLQQYGVSPTDPAWTYVTGTPAQIQHVVNDGYHVFFQQISLADESKQIAKEKQEGTYTPETPVPNALQAKAKPDYDIVHNQQIDVVAPDGHIAALFSAGASVSETDLYEAVQHAINDR
jgi:cytochrome oxidase Cu insertion factor (SCO1/SenC/PrrC family)